MGRVELAAQNRLVKRGTSMPMRPDLVEGVSTSIREQRKSPKKNRRKSSRKLTVMGGTIVYGKHRRKMKCVVLNISDGGARLLPADLHKCPDRFSLTITDQPIRDCEVVWRDYECVGVMFT